MSAPATQFKLWTPTPPMGWNSYNCFGATVVESEMRANADYMAAKLRRFGWEFVVVDYCWSYPTPPGSFQNNPPQFESPLDKSPVPWLAMDEWGRLLPDERRFPTARDGKGFKPLADYMHGLGLNFGIHIMRGIPWQAVWAKTPIKGAKGITADMIADKTAVCPWLNQMYGVDMSKPGAAEYYNSLAELYASWDVDYIKMDDVDAGKPGYPYRAAEAEAMRNAIDATGRRIVLSLSLNLKFENRAHIASVANLWRISKDFWDEWPQMKPQFELLHRWSPARGPGGWPDADMLQLGRISRRGPDGPERWTRFSKDEQITHMTLWCIARSPLMMGGDMVMNTPFVESLLTNEEVIAANQLASNPRQLSRIGDAVVWVSDAPDGRSRYIACFNIGDKPSAIFADLAAAGLSGACTARDLWARKTVGNATGTFAPRVPAHGARIFLLTPKA